MAILQIPNPTKVTTIKHTTKDLISFYGDIDLPIWPVSILFHKIINPYFGNFFICESSKQERIIAIW
jgi:hypothetical protein